MIRVGIIVGNIDTYLVVRWENYRDQVVVTGTIEIGGRVHRPGIVRVVSMSSPREISRDLLATAVKATIADLLDVPEEEFLHLAPLLSANTHL